MAEEIPTELIEHVFSFAVHADVATCLSICLTNRLGRRVATPALYETVSVAPPARADSDTSFAGRLRRLALLCRTLLENRSLAQHVTSVQQFCHGDDEPLAELVKLPPPPNPEHLRQLIDHELQLRPSVNDLVWHLLRDFAAEQEYLDGRGEFQEPWYGENTFLALLVLACPSLKRIELSGLIQSFLTANNALRVLADNSHSRDSDDGPEMPGQHVMHVKELSINLANEFDADGLDELWLLPTLEKLRIEGLVEDAIMPDEMTEDESQIHELILESCSADSFIINWIVTVCCNLKSLEISWLQGDYDADIFRDLGTAMKEYVTELEHIRLEMPPSHGMYGSFPGLGSLRALEKLHTLTVTDYILFGSADTNDDYQIEEDKQPATLETLLPDSMKKLEIITSGEELSQKDLDILTMPGAARLEGLTIFNSSKTQSISKDTSIGGRVLKRSASDTELEGQPIASLSRVE